MVIENSDITRYSGTELYLPLLEEKLNDIGILDDDIKILIAFGIHRKQTVAEHEKIVGPIYGRIRVIDHDCDDWEGIVFLGRAFGGIDVEVNRKIVDADRLILTGNIGFTTSPVSVAAESRFFPEWQAASHAWRAILPC